jgi:hypothetical protein
MSFGMVRGYAKMACCLLRARVFDIDLEIKNYKSETDQQR